MIALASMEGKFSEGFVVGFFVVALVGFAVVGFFVVDVGIVVGFGDVVGLGGVGVGIGIVVGFGDVVGVCVGFVVGLVVGLFVVGFTVVIIDTCIFVAGSEGRSAGVVGATVGFAGASGWGSMVVCCVGLLVGTEVVAAVVWEVVLVEEGA